jgi:hypothetical protein
MNNKFEKKRRKMLRVSLQTYQEMLRQTAFENAKIIKPKPKFIPMWIWLFLLGFFIKIK